LYHSTCFDLLCNLLQGSVYNKNTTNKSKCVECVLYRWRRCIASAWGRRPAAAWVGTRLVQALSNTVHTHAQFLTQLKLYSTCFDLLHRYVNICTHNITIVTVCCRNNQEKLDLLTAMKLSVLLQHTPHPVRSKKHKGANNLITSTKVYEQPAQFKTWKSLGS